METVLLTGGMGYIGSHTAVELLREGYDVIIADDLSNSSAEVLDSIEKITGVRPLFYQVNAADKEQMQPIFRDRAVSAVIHFAGYKAVGESVAKPLMYYRNNIDSALTVLELMAEYEVQRFIFSSSATVYGEHNVPPMTEDLPTGGITNPYGWTKYMIEQILRDAAKADQELSVVLLRYFNPIGADESGLIGEKPNGIPNNLMPYVAQVAAGIRDHLNVFGNDYPTPDGTGIRDYIHVTDLARGHVAALRYSRTHTGAETFNLGTGRGVSVLELIHAFEKANGISIPYEIAPRRAGDIAEMYAAPDKAEKILHWRAEKTIEDCCRDTWRFQKKIADELRVLRSR